MMKYWLRTMALAACICVMAACGGLPGGASEIPSGTYISNSGAGNDRAQAVSGKLFDCRGRSIVPSRALIRQPEANLR